MLDECVRVYLAVVALTGFACDSKPAPSATTPSPTDKAPEPKPADEGAKTKPVTEDPNTKPAPESAKALPAEAITFAAADGSTVHADYYGFSGDATQPIVVLFHQAGWNAGEYEPIAPRLQALGYAALATDQRSGGTVNGRDNRTVKARGESTKYLPAYPDLEAALKWAGDKHAGPVAVWGSSYSAALVFKLAGEHPEEIAAVLSFSPGEYMGEKGTVAAWAKNVKAPLFVTSAPGDEVAAAKALHDATKSTHKVQHVPTKGVHGSSILREDKNAGGTASAWAAVEAFLRAQLAVQ